jgi:hypothetical protein
MLRFHGSIDSKSSTVHRCGKRSKSRDKYACGSMPFALQVSTSENRLALALAPATVSLNNPPFLPTTKGRIAFSQRLLSRGTSPCLRNTVSLGHCPSV